ncbi:head decoration protein [Novosphingobium sp. ST904]|uniref:head decoration protein n=1 Tax=Novosphingobium sp. ST904 TaxID=1684385 RepID=UPI0006C857DB|nr:head decoration protein [Novosphingobium sp. ST904]KPH66042.1 hypothetical protein ADT71_08745 [Novosphingobium sp. ST904]TCM33792.1 bacteriophage lambda head decoration protein D [Novosphingobium sp. ST904]
MAILTEGIHTAGFLISEAKGMYRSRDQVTVAGGASPGLVAGTILGKLTSGGNFVRYTPGASDGSQTVAGILFEGVVGTAKRTVVSRDAQVVGAHLTYSAGADAAAIATANAALATLGIIVR